MSVVEVKNLSVTFDTVRGPLKAVDGISFSVTEGGSLGIVGESGSGKSVTSLAMMGLLPDSAEVGFDHLNICGTDMKSLSDGQRRQVLGRDISMIFQDPMTSLNPSLSVGFQLSEVVRRVDRLSKSQLNNRLLELLDQVGIKGEARILKSFPHELSGGMNQRIMIAMAIAGRPKVLIADEPTTALDVTIQKQILDLIKDLQLQLGMALILITHDIGVVASMSEKLVVMYAGQIVEAGPTKSVISSPSHPYTEKLLGCLPTAKKMRRLQTIPGLVPDLTRLSGGCRLAPRCEFADDLCRATEPQIELAKLRSARCHHPVGGAHV